MRWVERYAGRASRATKNGTGKRRCWGVAGEMVVLSLSVSAGDKEKLDEDSGEESMPW